MLLPALTENKRNRLFITLGLGLFLYTLLASLFIQLVALPYIFPAWHGGNGLLVGGDWIDYHRIALETTDSIRTEGWSAWQLRPEDQAPAGIAALFYTLTGISQPYVLLPLNALLHALSALILLALVRGVTGKTHIALWSTVPFALFPTAFLWNASLHKDGFFIAGSLLFIYGFTRFASPQKKGNGKHLITAAAALFAGVLLVWVVRPYGTEMLLYIAIFIAAGTTLYLLATRGFATYNLVNIAVLWAALVLVMPLTGTGIHHLYVEEVTAQITFSSPAETGPKMEMASLAENNPPAQAGLEDRGAADPVEFEPGSSQVFTGAGCAGCDRYNGNDGNDRYNRYDGDDGDDYCSSVDGYNHLDKCVNKYGNEDEYEVKAAVKDDDREAYLPPSAGCMTDMEKEEKASGSSDNSLLAENSGKVWHPSPVLPGRVDEVLYTLSVMRDRYRTHKPGARSNLDVEIKFDSAGDVVSYIPRALQIGFFSPFPRQWFEEGQMDPTTFMRRVVALEMIVIYPALLLACLALWRLKGRAEIYIIYAFCIGMILTYSLVVVNVGTLHRMRYGFVMTLVAFGVVGFTLYLEQLRKKSGQ